MRILLAMLTCLLAVTTSASAECAWVLWSEWLDPNTSRWDALDAVESKARCLSIMSEKVKGMAKAGAEVLGDSLVTLKKDGKVSSIWFRCLPDTVDPRGPKGK